jgi:hypothetical protein
MKLDLDGWLAQRWMRIVLWSIIGALSVAKFLYLSADFPNWSIWMIDQAKFTDEGWWAGAAVMHALTGHWYVAGDYNPAVALPVWPILLGVLFHFTGVSVVAARALNVLLSTATLGVVFVLVRRSAGGKSDTPALWATLLLASSPFAFVFNRLAILETLVVFEFCLLMLAASCASAKRIGPLAALAALATTMLLTKTTAALLIPAVGWMAWSSIGRNAPGLLKSIAALILVPAAFVKGYAAFASALGYGADYNYFFGVNAMPDIDWRQTLSTLHDLFLNCFWIDRVLYPVGLVILVVTAAWKRKLWSNPLFTASWIAIGAQVAFIFHRQDDYAPRYFLAMLPPLVWIVALTFSELLAHARKNDSQNPASEIPSPPKPLHAPSLRVFRERMGNHEPHPAHLESGFWTSSKTALLLLVAMAGAVVANAVMIGQFFTHREYGFHDAAISIQAIIRSHPEQKPLMLGVSGPQISLMTGIPSINDFYGTEDAAEKLARYQPGWYLAWNGIAPENEALLAPYRLEKMASYPAFDDDERTTLILYRMVRREDHD